MTGTRRGHGIAVVAAVLATMVLAGCGLVNSGGKGAAPAASTATLNGGSSAAPAASPAVGKTAAWQVKQQQGNAVGTVTDGSELVTVADTGVYAYNRADGKLLWTLNAPGGGAFCGSGRQPAAGKLPVGFSKSADRVDCSSLGVIDLRAGKMLWTTTIPTPAIQQLNEGGTVTLDGVLTEISGGTVMATWFGYGFGFSLDDGHRLWTDPFQVDQVDDLAAADGKFYGVFQVSDPDPGQAPMALDGIDPATGGMTSRVRLTSQITHTGDPTYGVIVNTSPMTLMVEDQSSETLASYVLLDQAKARVARVIPAGAQDQSAPAGDRTLFTVPVSGNAFSHPIVPAIVTGNTLIAVTASTGKQDPHGLTAFNLSTGARLWTAILPHTDMITPVAADGSAIVAVGSAVSGDSDGNPALVRVSLASGDVLSATPRTTNGDPIGRSLGFYRFTWADGRVYAASWNESSSLDDQPTEFTLSPAPA